MAPAGLAILLAMAGGACLDGEPRSQYASLVDEWLATPFVDPSAPYADPTRALGPPDGKTVAVGQGGALVLRFFREIPNGPGPDLRVVEIGPDGARGRIALSSDGETFFELADPAGDGGPTLFDLDEAGLPRARSVRIRGMDNAGDDPGFDLDAVEALH